MRIGSAIVAGVSIVSLLMVDLFGVAPAIRWSLRNLESKSGIQLQFDRATGHLLLGQVELHGIHANRKNHPSSNFDVKSERTAIHVSLWKVLWSKTGLERVVIDGLEGDYERLSKPEQHPARRGFEIGSFQMIRSRLKVTDRTVEGDPPTLDIAVQKLDCTPLRSLYAPFDLLIRATIEGTIGGHPYSVVCRKTDDSRVTEWHFRHLPVSLVGSYFGGPFEWLVAGSADIDLENRWDRAAGIKQKLKCQSVFENIRGEVPDDIGPRKRKIAELAVRYFNDHAQRMEFGFDLDLKAGRLDASSSEDLKELWNAIAEATVNAFFEVCSEKIDGFKEATREAAIGLFDKAKGAAKEHLDRLKSDRNGGDKVKPE